MIVLAVAALAVERCPFPVDRWMTIAAKHAIPPAAVSAFGDIAEKGKRFQASDALPPGVHPPFARFVAAEGRGCDLLLHYEQGRIAHTWRTAVLRFASNRWATVSR